MNGKKIRPLVLGSLSVLAGAVLGALSIRTALYELQVGAFGGWEIAVTVMRFVVATYFIWIGVRAIRRVEENVAATRFGWGKMLLGVTLIYAGLRGHFAPTPGSLQPDSAAQIAGIDFITGLFHLVGIALIVAGFRKAKRQPAAILPEQSNSAAGHS